MMTHFFTQWGLLGQGGILDFVWATILIMPVFSIIAIGYARQLYAHSSKLANWVYGLLFIPFVLLYVDLVINSLISK